MKISSITALMVFGSIGAALAQGQENNATTRIKWTGDITFTAKTAACLWNPVLSHAIVRFRPSGLGTNGTNSNLTIFYQTYAMGFRVAGRFDTTLKVVDAADIGGGFGNWNPQVRFISQTPATLETFTTQVTIKGQIVGFDYTPACTVDFTMTALRDYED
jgi:hypothetical protein